MNGPPTTIFCNLLILKLYIYPKSAEIKLFNVFPRHCSLFWSLVFFIFLAYLDEESPSIKIRPFDKCTESEMVYVNIDSRTGKLLINVDGRVQGNQNIVMLEQTASFDRICKYSLQLNLFNIWNDMPVDIREASTLICFKKKLKAHLLADQK